MSTGLQAILANPAALASLQNTMGPATVQTQGEAEAERARADLAAALESLGQRASAASGEAAQAAQAYGAAASAPMPQVDPIEALVNRIGSRTASVLSGDRSYAEGGEKRVDQMHADLIRARVDNLTALKDQWAMKAQAAKEMGNLEEELKGRANVEKFSKTIDGLLQAQRDAAADDRNAADNRAAMERVKQQGANALALERLRQQGDQVGMAADYATPYMTSTGIEMHYLNPAKIPSIKARQAAVDAARNAGIPVLTQKQEDGLHLLQESFTNLGTIQRQTVGELNEVTGQLEGGFLPEGEWSVDRPLNAVVGRLQIGEKGKKIAGYRAFRTAAINFIQSLASLGPGLRINQAEINAAMKFDIPTETDTRGAAESKIKNLNTMFRHVEESLLGLPHPDPPIHSQELGIKWTPNDQPSQPARPGKARRQNSSEFDDEVNEVLGN